MRRVALLLSLALLEGITGCVGTNNSNPLNVQSQMGGGDDQASPTPTPNPITPAHNSTGIKVNAMITPGGGIGKSHSVTVFASIGGIGATTQPKDAFLSVTTGAGAMIYSGDNSQHQ